jgi:hypothetical protein
MVATFKWISALLWLLGSPPDPTLLVYSVFIVTLVSSLTLNKVRSFTLRLVFALLLGGYLAEVLAWFSNRLANETNPALLHPELLPDLLLATGFYGGWAVAWRLTLQFFRFSLLESFIISGLFGVLLEQDSAVLRGIVQALPVNPLQALILAFYVFLVYGSVLGIAYRLADVKNSQRGKRNNILKYPIVFALMFVSMNVFTGLVFLVANSFGLLPTP